MRFGRQFVVGASRRSAQRQASQVGRRALRSEARFSTASGAKKSALQLHGLWPGVQSVLRARLAAALVLCHCTNRCAAGGQLSKSQIQKHNPPSVQLALCTVGGFNQGQSRRSRGLLCKGAG